MPAFVPNGPEIPERLLQAHEDGRVVFFCGAGISSPAGLPDFRTLIKQLYEQLGESPNEIEKVALRAKQYDRVVELLEEPRRITNGRIRVRKALASLLVPVLTRPQACVLHKSLLTLAQGRDHRVRLVTTNFDRIFETIIADRPLNRFCAPLLPIPDERWDGLGYLHGLLPPSGSLSTENVQADALDRLVVSSGDFGRAYLTERWAARFIGELLRNYSIYFIGYSIEDPVLRYMLDAYDAGKSSNEMFAFGNHQKDRKERSEQEWRAKKVTPNPLQEIQKSLLSARDIACMGLNVPRWCARQEVHCEAACGCCSKPAFP